MTRWLLALGIVSFSISSSLDARADEPTKEEATAPRRVLSLRVEGFDDPSALRKRLERELAVTLADEGEDEAEGELIVRYDPRTRAVTVSVRSLDERLERTVNVGLGPVDRERAAVLLSANLARAAREPKEAAPSRPATEPAPTRNEESIRLDVLEANIRSVDEGASPRWPLGLTSLGLGAGLFSLALVEDADSLRPWVSGAGGALMAFGGAYLLLRAGPHADLRAEIARSRASGGPDTLARTEEIVERAADRARRGRVLGGAISAALGATALGLGTVLALQRPERQPATFGVMEGDVHLVPSSKDSEERREAFAGGLLSLGAVLSLAGVHALVVPSDLEKARSAYKHAFSPPPARVTVRPSFAPQSGGGFIGLHGAF